METSIGVVWRTLNGGASTISYGIDDVSENSADVTPEEFQEGGSTVYQYYIKLENLSAGEIYKYKVEGDNDVQPQPGEGSHDLDHYEFKVSPTDGNFKLLVGSDWHHDAGNYPSFAITYQDMLEFDPDVIFLTGDIVGGFAERYQEFFLTCRKLFATAIFAPTSGNHDDDGDLEWILWRRIFYLPENGPAGHEKLTYSFDYGGSHFAALFIWNIADEWLDEDLASAEARGVRFIFGGHHYPIGERSIDIKPVYDAHGADIDFSGHNHRHHRSYPNLSSVHDRKGIIVIPEKDHYGANIEGTIYHKIRSLRYGKTRTYPDLHHASYSENKSYIGYTEITLAGNSCTVESYAYALNGDGRYLEDRYVIDKDDTTELLTPAVSNVNITEIGAHRAVIEWQSDIPSRGQVEFGTSSGDYSFVNMRDEQNQIFTTTHIAALQCLEPSTTYYFRAKSWLAGKEGVSAESSFTTNPVAEEGELVAGFDFGPIDLAPSPGTRVSPGDFDGTIGQGWYTKLDRPDPWISKGVGASSSRGETTYCVVPNDYQYRCTWQTEIPNGDYDIEVTVGRAHSYYFGDTHIDIEDGQVIFEAPRPIDLQTLWVWPQTFSIDDGFLDIELGYGDSEIDKCTILNQVRIWTKGHFDEYPDPDVTPPDPVVDLDVSGRTQDSLTVSWTAPGDDGSTGTATNYNLRWSGNSRIISAWNWGTYPVPNTPQPEVAGTVQSATLTGLQPNTTYYFAMRTQDEVPNNSDFSNVASGTTLSDDTTPPSVPGSVAATVINSARINLTWNASTDPETGIDHYNIYRDDVKIGESTTLEYKDKPLTASILYRYRISAVNGGDLESDKSTEAQATTSIDGDTDNDSDVDIFDLQRVAFAFGSIPGDSTWNEHADVTGDDACSIHDLFECATNFGIGV